MEIFFEIHSGLPREGPGSFESTRKALSLLEDLPAVPHILDVGCGPGMQTLDLARLTDGTIVAVDNHQPFLDQLDKRAAKQGFANRIETLSGDMNALGFESQTFDLIWAEGSIYIMGFENGLRKWRSLAKPGGYLAVTEVSWLRPEVPAPVREFWDEAYPAIQGIGDNLEVIRRADYEVVGHFTIHESDWWTDYYHPIEGKLTALREKYRSNAKAMAVLEEEQKEIDLFKSYSAYYGYVFYLMQIQSPPPRPLQ